MTIYSKTMGNGYVIAAVLGKKEIMDAAQGSWISSTFWTDRIGPTAALAALDVMEKEKSWEQITAKGLQNKERWQALADKYGLKINQWGIPDLPGNNTFHSKELFQIYEATPGYSPLLIVATEDGKPCPDNQ